MENADVPPAPAPHTLASVLKFLALGLRPKQWAKNALLFAGLLFTSDQAHPAGDYARALGGFAIFCILSGCTYLLNDIVDVEADRLHPRKRWRPIASGRLPLSVARGFAFTAAPLALFCAYYFLNPRFFLAAALYAGVTLAYSFALKNVVLVDVLALASGFVLRAVAGAFAISAPVSEWLLLCTMLLALFIGLNKRRSEIVALGDAPATRRILSEYSVPLLDQMITIVAGACLISYTLYTFHSVHSGQRHPYLMATVPFVLYGLFRYLYLSHRKGMGEAPEDVLARDKPLLVNILLYTLVAILAMQAR